LRRDTATCGSFFLAAALLLAAPLASQQSWGEWTPGAAAFGHWTWGPPAANVAALPTCEASTDGFVRAVLDTGSGDPGLFQCTSSVGWSGFSTKGGLLILGTDAGLKRTAAGTLEATDAAGATGSGAFRSGRLYAIGSDGTQRATLQGDGTGKLSLHSEATITWGSPDAGLRYRSPAVIEPTDGADGPGALRLPPMSTPPVTCGSANTEGTVYTDTDGAKAFCWCDGTNWVVVAGAGACA
jgi:hypothetical protein